MKLATGGIGPGLRRAVHATLLAATASALTTACGGIDADGAPTAADKADFCMMWYRQATDINDTITKGLDSPDGEMPSGDDLADVMHVWASDMAAVGTPEGIPSDARDGFEYALNDAASTDPDDVDPSKVDPSDSVNDWRDLSSEEFKAVRAFNDYLTETCRPIWQERGLLP